MPQTIKFRFALHPWTQWKEETVKSLHVKEGIVWIDGRMRGSFETFELEVVGDGHFDGGFTVDFESMSMTGHEISGLTPENYRATGGFDSHLYHREMRVGADGKASVRVRKTR